MVSGKQIVLTVAEKMPHASDVAPSIVWKKERIQKPEEH